MDEGIMNFNNMILILKILTQQININYDNSYFRLVGFCFTGKNRRHAAVKKFFPEAELLYSF